MVLESSNVFLGILRVFRSFEFINVSWSHVLGEAANTVMPLMGEFSPPPPFFFPYSFFLRSPTLDRTERGIDAGFPKEAR